MSSFWPKNQQQKNKWAFSNVLICLIGWGFFLAMVRQRIKTSFTTCSGNAPLLLTAVMPPPGRHGILIFSCLLFVLFEKNLLYHGILMGKENLIFYTKLLNLEILIGSCFPFKLIYVLTMSSLEYFCQEFICMQK